MILKKTVRNNCIILLLDIIYTCPCIGPIFMRHLMMATQE